MIPTGTFEVVIPYFITVGLALFIGLKKSKGSKP